LINSRSSNRFQDGKNLQGKNLQGKNLQGNERTWLRYLYCYIAWIILSALGFLLIFQVREGLLAITMALRLNPWAPQAIDRWSIYIMGMIWVFAVFSLEGYLKTSTKKYRLWATVGRIFFILGLIAAISFGLTILF